MTLFSLIMREENLDNPMVVKFSDVSKTRQKNEKKKRY